MGIYFELFITFLKIGLFSIGGGLASLALIEAEVVLLKSWIDFTQFTDLIALSQMTPGPIALNASTFIGNRVGGFGGALVASTGSVLPGLIIVTILYKLYTKHSDGYFMQGTMRGLRPAVVALIATAGAKIMRFAIFTDLTKVYVIEHINLLAIAFFCITLFAIRVKKTNPVLTMLVVGLCGGVVYLFV